MTKAMSLLEKGALVDNIYRVVNELGRGGMAVVYKSEVRWSHFDFALLLSFHDALQKQSWATRQACRQERYAFWCKKPRVELQAQVHKRRIPVPRDKKCALKVMFPNEKLQERFEAEWMQLCANNHPNLVHVFGGGCWNGYHYYAMELIPEIYSLEVLHQGLTIAQKIDIIMQTANGLAALHARGIIHRDIKPENLIVFWDGAKLRVKISDLGIAKDTTRKSALTLSQQMMGTPYFMSPEQVKQAKSVDERSDIYSLGATLYCLVCGVPPYHGMEMHETLVALATGQSPLPPRAVSRKVSPALEKLILKLIAYDPAERPASVLEVRELLRAHIRASGRHKKSHKAGTRSRRSTREETRAASSTTTTPSRTTTTPSRTATTPSRTATNPSRVRKSTKSSAVRSGVYPAFEEQRSSAKRKSGLKPTKSMVKRESRQTTGKHPVKIGRKKRKGFALDKGPLRRKSRSNLSPAGHAREKDTGTLSCSPRPPVAASSKSPRVALSSKSPRETGPVALSPKSPRETGPNSLEELSGIVKINAQFHHPPPFQDRQLDFSDKAFEPDTAVQEDVSGIVPIPEQLLYHAHTGSKPNEEQLEITRDSRAKLFLLLCGLIFILVLFFVILMMLLTNN